MKLTPSPPFTALIVLAALLSSGCATNPQHQAGDVTKPIDTSELAKQTQNPVADLISLPVQLNSGFGVGPGDNTQHILNIQPVYPQRLDDEWNLIHRAIIPLVDQPSLAPGLGSTSGLGNITYQGFLSPAHPDGVIWGVGPAIVAPTRTDERLGPHEWAAGPAFVALTMSGPWVVGGVVSHVWGMAADAATNFTTVQPFVNYNFDAGWYLTASPVITANWEADRGGNVWTVPIGFGGGRTFRMGKQPVNVNLQFFENVQRPHDSAEWSSRLSFTWLFPK